MPGAGDASQDVTLRFQSADLEKVLQDIQTIENALTRMYAKGSAAGSTPVLSAGPPTTTIGGAYDMAMNAGAPMTSSADNTHPSQISVQQYNPGMAMSAPVPYSGVSGGATVANAAWPVTSSYSQPLAPASANYNPAPAQSMQTPPGSPQAATPPSGGAYTPPPPPQPNAPASPPPAGDGGGGGGVTWQQIAGTAMFGLTQVQNKWMLPDIAATHYMGQQVGGLVNQYMSPYWQTQSALASGNIVSPEDRAAIGASRWGAYGMAGGSLLGFGIGAALAPLTGGISIPVAMGLMGVGGAIGGGLGSGMASVEISEQQSLKNQRLIQQRWIAGGGDLGTVNYTYPKDWRGSGGMMDTGITSSGPDRLNLHGYIAARFDNDPALKDLVGNPIITTMDIMDAAGGNIFPENNRARNGKFANADTAIGLIRRLKEQALPAAQTAGRFAMSQYGAPMLEEMFDRQGMPRMGTAGSMSIIPYLMGDFSAGNDLAAYGGVNPAYQHQMRAAGVAMRTSQFNYGIAAYGPQMASAEAAEVEMMGGSAEEIGEAMSSGSGDYATMKSELKRQITNVERWQRKNPRAASGLESMKRQLKLQLQQVSNQEKMQDVIGPKQLLFAEKSAGLGHNISMSTMQLSQDIMSGSDFAGLRHDYDAMAAGYGAQADYIGKLLSNPESVLGRKLSPTERYQYEEQYRQARNQQTLGVPTARTQMRLGMSEASFSLQSTEAAAATTLARTFGGNPSSIYAAETAELDVLVQKRKELEDIERHGIMGMVERKALQAEITNLVVQENVGRYQAVMGMARNNMAIASSTNTAGAAMQSFVIGTGLGSNVTAPTMNAQESAIRTLASNQKYMMTHGATPTERADATAGYYSSLSQIGDLSVQSMYNSIPLATKERMEATQFETFKLNTTWSERGNIRATQRESMSTAQDKMAAIQERWESYTPEQKMNPALRYATNQMMRQAQTEYYSAKAQLEQGWTERIVSFASGMPGNFNLAGAHFNYANAVSHGISARKFGGTAADVANYKDFPLWANSYGGAGRSNTPQGIIANAFMYGGTGSGDGLANNGFLDIDEQMSYDYANTLSGSIKEANLPDVPGAASLPGYSKGVAGGTGGVKPQQVEVTLKLVAPPGWGLDAKTSAVNAQNQGVSVKLKPGVNNTM